MTLEENGKNIANNFNVLGLPCDYVNGYTSPLGYTFLFNLHNINDYNEGKIKDYIKKQSVYLHEKMLFVSSQEAHFGVFVKAKGQPKVSLTEMLTHTNENGNIYIGKDKQGQLVKLDFERAPHLLIGGTTGSGKTNLLKTIICNVIVSTIKRQQKHCFILIDNKYELQQFAPLESEFICISDTRKAIEQLKTLCLIMDNIYSGKLDKERFGEIYVIIDELADLMLTSKYEVEQSIVRLAQKGRACGIHLILATQTPRVNVVSGLIKAQIPYRIGLKTANVRDSVVMLDEKGCETLEGNGDCIIKYGEERTLCQIAYAEPQLIQELTKLGG